MLRPRARRGAASTTAPAKAPESQSPRHAQRRAKVHDDHDGGLFRSRQGEGAQEEARARLLIQLRAFGTIK